MTDFKMLGCILFITNTIGALVCIFLLREFDAELAVIAAFCAAILAYKYRPQLKILWNRIFNNDDNYRGGSFT
ncbi:hypothetical protein IAQ67_28900 (plasmid) [Paenibacillus peoriae]|uniref:Uncharacterized protein n=1 Tax=Paenibacillus peoriae TaxID=59893 RepID=A0A7H0YH19_9BACL|nr:hypothetical protein [Paenibacillus peoriae]QNR70377.1 hypothetical protein IAQ67_28900 [Paenibacillus peoriae]